MPHRILSVLFALAMFSTGCDVNPFDQAQVPIVSATVEPGAPPVISWTPEGAEIVRFFRGPTAGDGYTPEFIWEVQLGSNVGVTGLRSPVTYGVVPPEGVEPFPAPPLTVGEPYSVWVYRHDPRGTGDGFTNTHNNYTGTATFVP